MLYDIHSYVKFIATDLFERHWLSEDMMYNFAEECVETKKICIMYTEIMVSVVDNDFSSDFNMQSMKSENFIYLQTAATSKGPPKPPKLVTQGVTQDDKLEMVQVRT